MYAKSEAGLTAKQSLILCVPKSLSLVLRACVDVPFSTRYTELWRQNDRRSLLPAQNNRVIAGYVTVERKSPEVELGAMLLCPREVLQMKIRLHQRTSFCIESGPQTKTLNDCPVSADLAVSSSMICGICGRPCSSHAERESAHMA